MHERAFVLVPLAEIAPDARRAGPRPRAAISSRAVDAASVDEARIARRMKLPEKYRYIVVEGPIGAGKTTLARAISEASGAALMLEDPDANPFLPRFYENADRYALPTQLFFLFQRIDQLAALNQADLFRRATVADFMLEKDALFARLNLKDDELKLYEQIYEHLKPQAPAPDLVIYLQAAPETLIERVQPARRRLREEHTGCVSDRARRNLYAVLLPVHGGAAAHRQFRPAELSSSRRTISIC